MEPSKTPDDHLNLNDFNRIAGEALLRATINTCPGRQAILEVFEGKVEDEALKTWVRLHRENCPGCETCSWYHPEKR